MPLDKRLSFIFLLIIPLAIVFAFISIIVMAIFLILFILFEAGLYLYAKKNNKNFKEDFAFNNTPTFTFLIILAFILAFFFVDYKVLLITCGLCLIGIAVYDYYYKSSEKVNSRMVFMVFSGILLIIISVFSFHPHGFSGDFTSDFTDYSITYQEYDTDDDDYPTIYKSLFFFGIKTPENLSEFIVNYNHANISINLDLQEFISGTDVAFWDCNIYFRMIIYNDLAKSIILEEDLYGFTLWDRMKEFEGVLEFYTEAENISATSLELNSSYIKMGTYLLGILVEIPPEYTYNSELYVNNFGSWDGYIDIHIESVLNFGYLSDSNGYSWAVEYLGEQTQAENFFDDLIGIDVANMIVLFLILFSIFVLMGLLQGNISLIRYTNIFLGILFILGLFSTISITNSDVPTWMKILFSTQNAKYIWSAIQAVKYIIIMGSVYAVLVIISIWIADGLSEE